MARIGFIILTAVVIAANSLHAAVTNSGAIEKLVTFADSDRVRIEATLKSDGSAGIVQVSGAITHATTGKLLWEGSLGQPLGVPPSGGSVKLTSIISNLSPELWSPSSPTLYNLTVSAKQNEAVLAQEKLRFGFRSFESREGQFILNRRPVFLRGLAINPPGRGIPPATGESRAFAEAYVRFLKSQNVNTIRLTHDSQVWFDVCDELGMIVYQGQYGSPLGGRPGKQGPPEDYSASLAAYKSLFETYARHPSILIYILSNELPVSGARGKAFHDLLSRLCSDLKPWDPTRLYIGNAGYGEGREGDICDVHRYWGWYYNSFLTYYNLRDPTMFDHSALAAPERPREGGSASKQPLTFTECVGSFTGPSGEFNFVARKQLGAQLNWTGHSANQKEDAPRYQSFLLQQATESFRRLRPLNPRLAGIMPFTILFHNWSGIASFEQMKATPAMAQLARSYQPVLLSWELWSTEVFAPGGLLPIAHIVNDSDDGAPLTNAILNYQLVATNGDIVLQSEIPVPAIPYYGTWTRQIPLLLPRTMRSGDYRLVGKVTARGDTVSHNDTSMFIASHKGWDQPAVADRKLVVFDNDHRETHKMAGRLGFRISRFQPQLSVPKSLDDLLIIGENVWRSPVNPETLQSLKEFVDRGGRILCLRQDPAKFDSSWLPEPISFFSASANAATYPPTTRPFNDGMNINLERPDHPVFRGLDRHLLGLWSDTTGWNQTKPGFPDIYPVTAGFKLTKRDSLARTAILANYDRGLEGIALCEMISGKGSVICCGFELVAHCGVDPAADRLLANLVRYAASKEVHHAHPLIDSSIEWGNYASERGLVTGPLNGLVVNADWVAPPTNPNAKPISQSEGAWNTRPGDQFLPHGRSPLGPFGYSTSTGLKDLNPDSKLGSGIFWARIPAGKSKVITSVTNPSREAGELTVAVNDSYSSGPVAIPAGKTVTIAAPIPNGATDISVQFTGTKSLVVLLTQFEDR